MVALALWPCGGIPRVGPWSLLDVLEAKKPHGSRPARLLCAKHKKNRHMCYKSVACRRYWIACGIAPAPIVCHPTYGVGQGVRCMCGYQKSKPLILWLKKVGPHQGSMAAEFGRRRQFLLVHVARRVWVTAGRHRDPLVADLHRLIIAISRVVVNHDGRGRMRYPP